MKNIPDLDKLNAVELIEVVQQAAVDLLAAGHTPDDLLQHERYRDLEEYVGDRLRALRDQNPQSSTIYAAMFPKQ
jgi:hypothetical protein